jgi:hypothetical protein
MMGGDGTYRHLTIELVLREARPSRSTYSTRSTATSRRRSPCRRNWTSSAVEQMETHAGRRHRLPADKLRPVPRGRGRSDSIPERYSDEFCRMKGCTQENINGNSTEADGYSPVHPDDREARRKGRTGPARPTTTRTTRNTASAQRTAATSGSASATPFFSPPATGDTSTPFITDIDGLKKAGDGSWKTSMTRRRPSSTPSPAPIWRRSGPT